MRLKVMLTLTITVLAMAAISVFVASPINIVDAQEPEAKAQAVGTAFTYQGRLTDGGNPANGLYDFVFSLYDTVSGGTQVGSDQTVDDVTVTDGFFTVQLDMGGNVFNGNPRYLEIEVRSGSSTGAYTALTPRRSITPAPYAIHADSATSLSAPDGNPVNAVVVDNDGNVGIGNPVPRSKLDIDLGASRSIEAGTPLGNGPGWVFRAGNGNRRDIVGSNPGIYMGASSNSGPANPDFVLRENGSVGIGTQTTGAKLHVEGDGVRLSAGSKFIEMSTKGAAVDLISETSSLFIRSVGTGDCPWDCNNVIINHLSSDGNVGIGTQEPSAKLEVNGDVLADNIQARGADLAEVFDLTNASTIEPGMVVSIDPEHIGQLQLSEKAYDRTVAGVVVGAGDIQPGMILNQSGQESDEALPISLAGRVYVWADADAAPIQAGDLLTTSDTPGHAMKVTDYQQGQGAILGKAMSSLDEGQGLVLVLVSLQ